MEVKSVFLPEAAVIEKVRRVTGSASSANQPFDEKAARQLYAYLVQPFERHLTGDEVIIVPQGPLVTLPFEALIDGRSGQFMVEKVAVSYAPSAAFAAKALRREPLVLPPVTAIYDEAIENDTSEIARLQGSLATGLEALPTRTLSADEAIEAFSGREALHVLLHGFFEQADPLQSRLSLENLDLSPEDNAVTAAELLASDWRRARIVVFSSCESAQMNVRISNEVYGLILGAPRRRRPRRGDEPLAGSRAEQRRLDGGFLRPARGGRRVAGDRRGRNDAADDQGNRGRALLLGRPAGLREIALEAPGRVRDQRGRAARDSVGCRLRLRLSGAARAILRARDRPGVQACRPGLCIRRRALLRHHPDLGAGVGAGDPRNPLGGARARARPSGCDGGSAAVADADRDCSDDPRVHEHSQGQRPVAAQRLTGVGP